MIAGISATSGKKVYIEIYFFKDCADIPATTDITRIPRGYPRFHADIRDCRLESWQEPPPRRAGSASEAGQAPSTSYKVPPRWAGHRSHQNMSSQKSDIFIVVRHFAPWRHRARCSKRRALLGSFFFLALFDLPSRLPKKHPVNVTERNARGTVVPRAFRSTTFTGCFWKQSRRQVGKGSKKERARASVFGQQFVSRTKVK